jgi:signal transduction histidine kinase
MVIEPGVPPHRARHDLKNQIGIIIGFSELLLAESGLNDRMRADIQEISTAARRAMELLSHARFADEDDAP